MVRCTVASILKFLFGLILILALAGIALPSRALANSAAVGQALGNMVNVADVTIQQIEQGIAQTTQDLGPNLGDQKLQGRVDRAQTPGDKAKAIEDRIEDQTGGLDVPWNVMSDHLRNLHRLAALYRALEAWQEIRSAWADAYEDVTGKVYQVSQLPGAGGVVCDQDEFAYNSVAVSTLHGKARMQVERDFVSNSSLRPQDVQVAVLTDMQQTLSGQAETGGKSEFNFAQLNGNGAPAASGSELDYKIGLSIGYKTDYLAEDQNQTAQDTANGEVNPEYYAALDNWLSGNVQFNSTGLDKDEPVMGDVQGAYMDCSKFQNFIPYNDTRLSLTASYDLSRFGGNALSSAWIADLFGGDSGTAKAYATCNETATSNFGDYAGGRQYFIQSKLRFGTRYRVEDAAPIATAVAEELARNDITAIQDAINVQWLPAANSDVGYAVVDVRGVGYHLNNAGCKNDISDLTLFNGDLMINQYRMINPATEAQLSAGGVQLAALPEPEDRVQVAAAASQALPNDFYFHAKGSIRKGLDDQWAMKAIGFKPAGRDGRGSLWPKQATPVLVAVVDTGLDPTHPDIAGALYANPKETPGNGKDDDNNGFVDDVFGWNFVDGTNNTWDNNGHGTFISGIIAARTDDKIGIAGVNPWARILPVKVSEFNGGSESVGLLEGIYYAVNQGARVINVSIGGRKLTKAEQFAIDYANDQGALVIVAAGNDGIDVSDYSPAGIPGAITVAATDHNNRRAKFSNFGAQVDIAAPGLDVLSLRARQTDLLLLADKNYEPGKNIVGDDGLYYHLSGTSFSAPFVAGVASLLFSLNEDLTPDQVKRMILQSARDIEDPGFDWLTGYGLLDAAAALKADPNFYVDARLTDVALVQQNGQNFLQPVGTAAADQFKQAWIEIGQGKQPDSWIKASDVMTQGVTEGALPLVGVQHFTAAGDWTFRLVVEHQNGRTREARYTLALN